MARAKRHYIPEQIWHITHRCHKREFLLKFAKDRQRWLQWTESIAVGSESFIEEIKEKLNVRAKGRKAIGAGTAFQLREPVSRYNTVLDIKKEDISLENTHSWDTNSVFSRG